MENENRERNAYSAEDDQPEEEKMEKFFALITKFHDARNQLLISKMEKKENKRRKTKSDEPQQSSWVPTFKLEDFAEEIDFKRLPVIFPDPCNKKEDEEDQEGRLDLKLTL
ncbi:unnamed protein product [Ilex paraguariensis]|uniref:Protein NIM1-INTERACTING 1 n=1 Tax=Ilex paraguariensis TaxID=185542 RepID=A0ABC8S6M2_9AQUA